MSLVLRPQIVRRGIMGMRVVVAVLVAVLVRVVVGDVGEVDVARSDGVP